MVFYGMDSPKTSKENELMKIMNFYAQSIIIERNKNKEKYNNLIFLNNDNFSIFIIKKNFFHGQVSYPNIDHETINKSLEKKFYQYVINYPNTKYYKFDRKMINEKENKIVDDIINILLLADNILLYLKALRFIIVPILYFLSCNCLIEGKLKFCFVYRWSIVLFNNILSFFISLIYNNYLMEKKQILNQKYIPDGYFIILNETIIQIFKLDEDYADKSLSIDEIYKKINEEINNLSKKI